MNPYVKEMDELIHRGMPRRSGRYPWGSGENPYQHSGDFLSRVEQLKKENYIYTDPETGEKYSGEVGIAKYMGLSTTQLRTQVSLAKSERRALLVATAKGLREKGYSLNEIAAEMGYKNDSSVRSLLNEEAAKNTDKAVATANLIREQINKKGMIDVGAGVERELGITREKMNQALYILEREGYPVYGGGVPQITNPGKQSNLKVICPPGTEHKDIFEYENIHSLKDYTSHDGGETFDKFQYPASMDSKRLEICYAEDGGKEKDGVIEIRRGAKDLSIGDSHYAQVRILVDGDRYLKGMAVYSDDLPDGVDVRFNTNKHKGTPKEDVLKKIKDDPDNPFGALVKANGQSYYTDENGERKLSLINKCREEGDWNDWSDKLPAQFLSKQSYALAKRQLKIAIDDKKAEFKDISELTNPVVKKKLLESFAEDCDSSAVHLQAAALPRQKYHVILPFPNMKDNEVFAPNYENGETVALIRYPHGGRFEIPILKVNNKQPDALRVLGNTPRDAVGINSNVAERLSGADFDGATVMVIPCNSDRSDVNIKNSPILTGLLGFDPKEKYPEHEGMVYMKYKKNGKEIDNTQIEMGKISNLITDMTLKGAEEEELARAVRHSMVVIDAGKHKLDYKQSEIDNGIASLKRKYQGGIGPDGKYHEGSSTLISRAKSEVSVVKRQGTPRIDPNTGSLVYKQADDAFYVDPRTGKEKVRTQPSTLMAETKDARTLISNYDTPMERVYADYANSMKDMAREARLSILATPNLEYSPSAKKTYQKEVAALTSRLNIALKNAPRERQAQVMANSIVKAKVQDNPSMTKSEIKKAGQMALVQARNAVGAKRNTIVISDKEWEAIQSGAVSSNLLSSIMDHADMDALRQLATPRSTKAISAAKEARIKSLAKYGYTAAEIARSVGVSASTVGEYLNS